MMKTLANELAKTIETELSPNELGELILLINWDWPEKKDYIRMSYLLAQIPLCHLHTPCKYPRLPFPAPFDKKENTPYLLSSLRALKVNALRKSQLKEYLEKNEEVILKKMMEVGDFSELVYEDVPEYLSHAVITRSLRPKFYRLLSQNPTLNNHA